DRAVPTAVRATVRGLDVADHAFLATEGEVRVPVERREQLPCGQLERGRVAAELDLRLVGAVGGALDPAHQRRLVLACDRPVGDATAGGRVEPVEADGLAYVGGDLEGEPGR